MYAVSRHTVLMVCVVNRFMTPSVSGDLSEWGKKERGIQLECQGWTKKHKK